MTPHLAQNLGSMKPRLTSLVASLFLLGALPAVSTAAPRLDGDWTGGFVHRGTWVNLAAQLTSEPGGFKGLVDVAFADYESERGVALTDTYANGEKVRFTAPTTRGSIVFDGRVTPGRISGRYRFDGSSGTFGLVATAPLDSAARAGLYGAYEVAPGHVVSAFDLYGGNLRFTDYQTGQQSTMYPVASDSFVSGPGQSVAWPVTDTFKLVRGGEGRAKELRWWSKGKGVRVARRLAFRETTLSCANDSITLGGTLILPNGPGPHPVIIVTPGDFGSSRDALRGYAFNFVRRGVAVLVFDSRGAGGSTGPVASSSFDDLAGDVLAWVALLRDRSEIDPKGIGLFGFSNSSWTVSLGASRSKDVAFLVPQSMSALHPWQQERFRAERQIGIAGYPEKDVRQAVEIMDLKFKVARTGEGWDRLQETIEKHRGDRWLPYTNPSRSLERLRAYWDRSFSYDPRPALERITCPTLFVFGGIDSNVPVDASIPIIKQAMERAGNTRYTIRVFPKGRHDLIEGKDGGPKEFPLMKRFVPGYWDALADWVAEGWRGGGVAR